MYVEVFPINPDSVKFQVPVQSGEREHFESNTSLGFGGTYVPSVVPNMESKKQTADIPAKGYESSELAKRLYSEFHTEAAKKRVKLEEQVCIPLEERYFSEPAWNVAAPVLAIPTAFDEDFSRKTGLDQLDDIQSPISELSNLRHIPIGSDHQADLPQWTPKPKTSYPQSRFQDAHSALGASSSSSPMDTQVGRSSIICQCTDKGSIACVRRHMLESREKLWRSLGPERFSELGFSDMGEDVAERWSEMEENLFHMVVSSNSATLGRNFWTVLSRAFPSRSFQELVSYYFNVFVLRKRADQNRLDPMNADSDNDEWQENRIGEFVTSDGEEEDEDSAVESPADGSSPTLGDDASDDVDEEGEDEYYCGKPMPRPQPAEGNSTDCSLDQDAQGDSCTSFERLCSADRHHENTQTEQRKFQYFDGDCDSKPWEVNYIGGTGKGFEFFPTCSVLEEVFGKGSWDKDARDGPGFS